MELLHWINGAKRGGKRATLRYPVLGIRFTVRFWVFWVPVSKSFHNYTKYTLYSNI